MANLVLEELVQALSVAMQTQGHVLALAESCTGGMVASAVTAAAGSSAWFDRGFVTYSNQAKVDMLGVQAETLAQYGAVSEQTAKEMALGALAHSQASIAGSITGIAGPSGGSAEKPVGMVCFAWAKKSASQPKPEVFISTVYFEGERQSVREQATKHMLTQLLQLSL